MNHDPKVEFREDHIHVEIGENYDGGGVSEEEYWQSLRALCDTHGTRRVLVEGYAPKGSRDTKQIVDAGIRTATVPDLWLAYNLVDHEPTDASELYEKIAAGRGVRVKFFSDSETALRWLRSNAPS